MKEFSFSTRIFFGENSLERLRRVENKKVLIITDRIIYDTGIAERVASYLTNCKVTFFADVKPDPTVDIVTEGVMCLKDCGAEVVVAVGGGSCIDAAKAIRAAASKMPELKTDIMECFAIPTTSGTGSEVTEYAVISDTETDSKYPLVHKALRPPVAILDPSLVVSAPPSVTSDSGIDVLTHAIEAYVSENANDFSDALAEKTVSLVFKWLPQAYHNGEDIEAREEMHNASCLAGLAFNSAGLGICHGIAHAVGGKLHIAHGKANAIILPYVIRFNAKLSNNRDTTLAARKYQRLAKILDLPCSSVLIGVNQLINAIEKINKNLKIPKNLRAAGCDMELFKEMEDEIIKAALEDMTTGTNPRKAEGKDVKKLLHDIAG